MSANQLNQVKTREEYKKIKEDERKKTAESTAAPNASKAKSAQKTSKVQGAQKTSKAESSPKAHTEEVSKKRVRIRLIPIWLRIVLLVLFTGASLIAGAAIGYGVLGGGNAGDVLKESTWTHILDLVEKK
jgi:hypothetical protein